MSIPFCGDCVHAYEHMNDPHSACYNCKEGRNFKQATNIASADPLAKIFHKHIKDLNTAIDKLGPLVARACDWLPSEKYTLIAELSVALDELTAVQNREYRAPNTQELLDTSKGEN